MTKTNVKGPDYGKVSADLVERVREVIAQSDKHRYSVSAVFGAYNEAFGKNDMPQTCSSCLRNRVRELRAWLEGYEKHVQPKPDAGVQPQYDNPDAPGYVPQAEGTVRYPMSEGIPFDFLPYEGTIVKGTVTRADGSKIKPGTYLTAEGLEIAVQPGGKANIKEAGEVSNPAADSGDNEGDLL